MICKHKSVSFNLALLMKLLLPLLEKTAQHGSDVRVVSVSSTEELGAYGRYFQSKLGNVLFARQLAKEYLWLTAVSLDPGIVGTNLMAGTTGSYWLLRAFGQIANRWVVPSVETGARNHLWASVSKVVKSGEFYGPVGVHGEASRDGQDDALAKELWDWTENELQSHVG